MSDEINPDWLLDRASGILIEAGEDYNDSEEVDGWLGGSIT